MYLNIILLDNYNNFGDMLMPFILKFFDVKTNIIKSDIKSDINNVDLYGIGSIAHMIPNDYKGYIWSTGFIYPNFKLNCINTPFAVRGKLSLNQIICNNKDNIILGDGGLILEKIYKPVIKKSYKLGVIPHYIDLIYKHNEPFETFNIFNSNDVLLIKSTNDVQDVIDMALSCDMIMTSSLHGLILCDSYNIPHCLYKTMETEMYMHKKQFSFKFHDYYSAFDMKFTGEDLFLDKNTSINECISKCKPVQINNEKIEKTKEDLYISLIKCINTISYNR